MVAENMHNTVPSLIEYGMEAYIFLLTSAVGNLNKIQYEA